MRREWLLGLVLAGLVLAVYWPVQRCEFLCYDDPEFVTDNPHVKAGLTWPSIRYAFTSAIVGNWHPVTTLSHILDCQVFGVHAGPMHLVNAVLHAANALLLFLVLRRLTGALWRSAIVAALFALHPLRVESVAWISERKDVLSGLFFLLTIWAYARYAQTLEESLKSKVLSLKSEGQRPRSRVQGRKSCFYVLALGFFALGLMSKPMLVTLPFVLLLLDYWPLRRFQRNTNNLKLKTLLSLLREKLPFFALAAMFSVLTLVLQARAGTTVLNAQFSFADRLANALASYARYLGKMFWPTDLAVIYPHAASRYYVRDQWPGWEVGAAALLLLAVSALCLCLVRRRPCLAVGWFWYLGTLVPVIGLIQAGEQAMADRYTYLPLIGPIVSLVWLLGELSLGRDAFQRASQDRLLGRASVLASPSSREPAGNQGSRGRSPSPASALRQSPHGVADANRKLMLAAPAMLAVVACALLTRHQLGYWQDSVTLFEHTVDITTDNPGAQFALGVGLEKQGDFRRAMVCYRVAFAILPSYAEAHYNLGHLLRKQGARREATEAYLAAIRYKPDDVKFRLNLAGVLMELGQTREAVRGFQEALQLDPDSVEALNNLAWMLAANADPAIRNGARAVEYGERVCRLTGFKQTIMVGTLAAAYAETGRFKEAVATAEKACALAKQNGEPALLEKNRQLLELYHAGKPYHEPGN